MNIDVSNAHCGPRILFPDHAWLRVAYIYATALPHSFAGRSAGGNVLFGKAIVGIRPQ